MGRFSESEAIRVADTIENTTNLRLLNPSFIKIPENSLIDNQVARNQNLYARKSKIIKMIQDIDQLTFY